MQAVGTPISQVYGRYKSGIPYDDLAEAGKAIAAPELDVDGVMMHMGRYTTDLAVIGQFQRRFGELVAEVSQLWGGWTPRSIDVGGGFAPPVDAFGRARPGYADPPPVPDIETYARTICAELAAGLGGAFPLAGRTLEVEPGRGLFAPCGIHAATVLNVKRQTVPFRQTWFETDTAVTFLSDIPVSFARPPLVPVYLPDGSAWDDEGRVVGHTCQSDVLAPRIALPAVSAGDILAFCFTGAYHEAGASNFNLLPRPATVLVSGSESCLIRRAETADEVLGRDVLPDRLRPGCPEAAA
jgi:diaminopimelate decarboxylase